MFDKFRSTISYKVVSYLSYPSLILYFFMLNKFEMLNIILVPCFLFLMFLIYCIGILVAVIEQRRVLQMNKTLLADIGFIIGWLIITSPLIYILLAIIDDNVRKLFVLPLS